MDVNQKTTNARMDFLSVMGVVVARPGFEPGQTESKSVVLPLYYRAVFFRTGAKIGFFKNVPK
jgi:hypothetical protein